MIQRIQSFFLLIASAGFWGLFALPFGSSKSGFSPLYEDQLFDINDNTGLIALVCLGGILSLVTIGLYKNRPLQKKLVYLTIAAGIGLLAGAIYLNLLIPEGDTQYGAGMIMPILSVIMGIAAMKFISKDDKLVRSMDRLR